MLVTTELNKNTLGKVAKEEEDSKKVVLTEMKVEGVERFLAQSRIPDQIYGIESVIAKDMHLALNQPNETSRLNL